MLNNGVVSTLTGYLTGYDLEHRRSIVDHILFVSVTTVVLKKSQGIVISEVTVLL